MPDDRTALFVRLTADQAERLHRAATALPARKKDLIGGLVDHYVDPSTPSGLAALRELTGATSTMHRRVTVDLGADAPVVGHADFRPLPPAEVLDAAQAAELLAVEEEAIVELAERGELPGRRIGDAWRFSRAALLQWLAAGT
jgi:excisionase family DNA binding protein